MRIFAVCCETNMLNIYSIVVCKISFYIKTLLVVFGIYIIDDSKWAAKLPYSCCILKFLKNYFKLDWWRCKSIDSRYWWKYYSVLSPLCSVIFNQSVYNTVALICIHMNLIGIEFCCMFAYVLPSDMKICWKYIL